MFYRWLAVAVIALHFGYLAYVVAGGYLAWRWPRTLALHLVAVVWAVLIIVTEVICPLTWLQNSMRTRAGLSELDLSFIDTYVSGVFFPADHEVATRLLVAVAIAVSWLGCASRSTHPSPRLRSSVAPVNEQRTADSPATSRHEESTSAKAHHTPAARAGTVGAAGDDSIVDSTT